MLAVVFGKRTEKISRPDFRSRHLRLPVLSRCCPGDVLEGAVELALVVVADLLADLLDRQGSAVKKLYDLLNPDALDVGGEGDAEILLECAAEIGGGIEVFLRHFVH